MTAVVFVAARSAREADRSLLCSLAAMTAAKQCAVLWFADIMRRGLFRALGYSSINQYAIKGLGFSKSRAGDFMRLARELEGLPAVHEAVASGELGYTKALEIIKVATPETEGKWLEVAEGSCKELAREVKKARRRAAVDPSQGELLPSTPAVVAPRELPVHMHVKFSPEQEARRAALVERLHKLGGVPSDRAELLLEALAALAEAKESKTRRLVLSRDRHQCQAPGCGRTRFLEVHHIKPRHLGGTNKPENLTTLCGSCHRLWHEQGGRADLGLAGRPW